MRGILGSSKSRSDRVEIRGLSVVVTGAARGIGRATVDRLADAGARVAAGDLDADLVAEVAAGHDGRVVAARLDVADAASWRDFLDATATVGPIDVLVNNAGIMPLGPVLEEADEVTRRVVDVNLHGVINGTKTVVPGMVERGRGQVVNVASALGRVAMGEGATYSATKFAVVGFSEATRGELAPHGIDVSMVLPSVVQTELAAGIRQARGLPVVTAEDVAEVIEDVVRRPQAEVWVPRWTQHMAKTSMALPRRVQDLMTRAFRADRLLAEADRAARADYERRVRGDRPEAQGGG